MVIKCKLRDRIEVEDISDQQAYQTNYPIPSRVVVDTDISSNPCFISGEVDIIELPRQWQHSIGQADKRDANTEDENDDDDEEEEFDDNVETESDEDNPQLSE